MNPIHRTWGMETVVHGHQLPLRVKFVLRFRPAPLVPAPACASHSNTQADEREVALVPCFVNSCTQASLHVPVFDCICWGRMSSSYHIVRCAERPSRVNRTSISIITGSGGRIPFGHFPCDQVCTNAILSTSGINQPGVYLVQGLRLSICSNCVDTTYVFLFAFPLVGEGPLRGDSQGRRYQLQRRWIRHAFPAQCRCALWHPKYILLIRIQPRCDAVTM